MNDYRRVVDKLAVQTKTDFRSAAVADLSALRSLNLPDSVVGFFAQFEPEDCAEGLVRLWPIEAIVQENRDYVPGAYIAPMGYVVFATTLCGDAYCFNLKKLNSDLEPEIVLISHEVIYEETSSADVARLAKPVAKDLYDFLDQFTRSEIDEECVY